MQRSYWLTVLAALLPTRMEVIYTTPQVNYSEFDDNEQITLNQSFQTANNTSWSHTPQSRRKLLIIITYESEVL